MKPIAIDDFCAVRSLANVTFSPEGTSACFTVSQAKKEKNCYESRLYLLKGGRVRALTGGGKESSFCYLDENTVLFAGDREGEKEPSLTSRFYKIALDGGEADLAYTFPIPVSQVFPLKNGDLLVVGSTFPGFEDLYKGDKKLVKAYFDDKKENEDYEVISQLPWWWNGGTYTRGAYESLFYYDAKKKSLTRLTDAGFNVSDVQLAEDQKTVYFSLLDVSVPRPAHFDGQDLYRIDLASRRQELVVKSRPDFVIATYALGKSFLLVMAADGKFGMNTDCDFYKLDYETLAVTPYAVYGEAIGSSVGCDVRHGGGQAFKMDGDVLYFISTRFDGAGLYKLEDGTVSPVLVRDGSVDCFDRKNSKMLLCALWDMKPQELYDETGRRVTHFNDAMLRGKYVAQPDSLNLTAGDHEVHGFILKPRDFEAGKKYPVIFDIHGGPKTVYGPVFYHEMQYWASRGYFVIFCNPTGSDGRGAFMDIRGKYGTVDFDDLMAFCDAALLRRLYDQLDHRPHRPLPRLRQPALDLELDELLRRVRHRPRLLRRPVRLDHLAGCRKILVAQPHEVRRQGQNADALSPLARGLPLPRRSGLSDVLRARCARRGEQTRPLPRREPRALPQRQAQAPHPPLKRDHRLVRAAQGLKWKFAKPPCRTSTRCWTSSPPQSATCTQTAMPRNGAMSTQTAASSPMISHAAAAM